jgi:hypothetical protein
MSYLQSGRFHVALVQEDGMANRQQRSNREKKKPKADKNKKKDAVPASPFTSARNPVSLAPGYAGKKA